MYKKADINTTGRKITGHSGRVTMCTTLFNAGYQEKTVKARSGHRSAAVQTYMRENIEMRKSVSSLLQSKSSSTVSTKPAENTEKKEKILRRRRA